MIAYKVGMNTESTKCSSIRSAKTPGEQCVNKPIPGSEWCGKHKSTQVRFVGSPGAAQPAKKEGAEVIEHVTESRVDKRGAAHTIFRRWRLWLARRAGPLLWAREESNNHADFFSGDPVAEIPLRDIVSFVSGGKGYIMDIKSATSLLEHATTAKETPLNPFNREVLSPCFLHRIGLHSNRKTKVTTWSPLEGMSETQRFALAVTDVFRSIEDLGYYTDPGWFLDLSRTQLQRVYIEIADIWHHRASLTSSDRIRIVPSGRPLGISVVAALSTNQKALRHHLLNACRLLTSIAPQKSDRQLGVMYVLGALSLVSPGAASAYPWLVEMFSPGVTRVIGSELIILHPSVMSY
jgi:hypothetical protein